MRRPNAVKLFEHFDRIDDDGKAPGFDLSLQEIALLFSKRRSPSGRFQLYENCTSGRIVSNYVASSWGNGLGYKPAALLIKSGLGFNDCYVEAAGSEPSHGFPL